MQRDWEAMVLFRDATKQMTRIPKSNTGHNPNTTASRGYPPLIPQGFRVRQQNLWNGKTPTLLPLRKAFLKFRKRLGPKLYALITVFRKLSFM